MKKYNIYLLVALLAFLAIGCTDDDKYPIDIHLDNDNYAPYVRLVIETPVIDATQLDGVVFSGELDDPADNVSTYALSVRKIRGTDTIPYASLKTVSTFPSRLEVTGQELASALNIPTSEIQPGDLVEFRGVSTGNDGSTLVFEQLGPDLFGQPEQFQSYQLPVFVACPFVQEDIVGTYDVITHSFDQFFGTQPPTREIIAGPGPNQYTILGGAIPLDGADDLVISVNPNTGQVSFGGDPSDIHFNTFGPGVYGTITGLTFSCVGFISLNITSPGFVTNTFVLQQQ